MVPLRVVVVSDSDGFVGCSFPRNVADCWDSVFRVFSWEKKGFFGVVCSSYLGSVPVFVEDDAARRVWLTAGDRSGIFPFISQALTIRLSSSVSTGNR